MYKRAARLAHLGKPLDLAGPIHAPAKPVRKSTKQKNKRQTGFALFSCPACDKVFSASSKFQAHVEKRHLPSYLYLLSEKRQKVLRQQRNIGTLTGAEKETTKKALRRKGTQGIRKSKDWTWNKTEIQAPYEL